MPGINDLYFPPEDNEIELRDIKNGELRTILQILATMQVRVKPNLI